LGRQAVGEGGADFDGVASLDEKPVTWAIRIAAQTKWFPQQVVD
jgi:hypothetical protein